MLVYISYFVINIRNKSDIIKIYRAYIKRNKLKINKQEYKHVK